MRTAVPKVMCIDWHVPTTLKERIMKLKQAAVAVSLFATAAAAMAVEATQWNPPSGQVPRAEVKSELARAQSSGELDGPGEAYAGFQVHVPQSTLARSDVKTELARARANGELEGRNEAYGGFPQQHSTATPIFAFRKPHNAKAADGGE
jgi:hypothetical protein